MERRKFNNFSYAMRTVRLFHGFNMCEMAAKIEASSPYLTVMEEGRIRPHRDHVDRVAELMGVSTETILLFAKRIEKGKKISDEDKRIFPENFLPIVEWYISKQNAA